jgi:hypothetical protein
VLLASDGPLVYVPLCGVDELSTAVVPLVSVSFQWPRRFDVMSWALVVAANVIATMTACRHGWLRFIETSSVNYVRFLRHRAYDGRYNATKV